MARLHEEESVTYHSDPAQEHGEEYAAPSLRSIRESMNLSLDDVAFAIRVSSRQIDQLEKGDFEKLPGTTFIRCLTRSYARHLNVDPSPFLSYYEDSLPKEKDLTSLGPAVCHPMRSVTHTVRVVLLVVAVAVVCINASIFFHYHNSVKKYAANASNKVTTQPTQDFTTLQQAIDKYPRIAG